jgi:DNA-binding GntR family transcriptional regulator
VEQTESMKLTVAPTLADQAYVVLRRQISDGELHPGQRLTERGLAELLGVSPTPVREAIRRLEHERFLERLDGRTLTVAQPSVHRLFELNLIEAALAGVAARLAAESATDFELREIRAVHEVAVQSVPEATTIDEGIEVLRLARQVHQLIYQASHNSQLIEMIAVAGAFDWRDRVESVRRLGPTYPSTPGLDGHLSIIDALEARDGVLAETLMREHVTSTGRRHLDVIAEDEFLGDT